MEDTIKNAVVIAVLVLAALGILFLPGASAVADGFSKFMFEGTASGRVFLFLGWAAFLFLLAAVAEASGTRVPKMGKATIAIPALLLACWFLQFYFQAQAAGRAGFPYEATVAAMGAGNGALGWEASQLVHMHITKGILYPALALMPFSGFDTGAQMHGLLQFDMSMVFLALVAAFFAFILAEFLNTKEGLAGRMLLAVFSFCALVSVFDGGPFTIIGRLALALLVAYALLRKGKTNGWNFFLMPYFAVAGFLYLCSFLLRSYAFMFASYEIFSIGLLLSLTLVFTAGKKRAKVFWLGVFIAIAFLSWQQIAGFGLGAEFYANEPAKIMVYGLPEGADGQNLASVLGSFGNAENVEVHNYIAFATITPASEVRAAEIEQKLVAELKPKSYLHVVKSWQRNEGVMRSDESLEGLLSLQSSYISFSRETVNGKEEIVAEGYFPHPYLSLFALNYLHFSQGVEKPVVFSMVK